MSDMISNMVGRQKLVDMDLVIVPAWGAEDTSQRGRKCWYVLSSEVL